MTSDSVVCLPSKASGDDTSASHVIETREGTHTLSWAGGQGRHGEGMLPPHTSQCHTTRHHVGTSSQRPPCLECRLSGSC